MITAIVLAAGESKRMGQPKMLMPWKKSTVLQTVISSLQSAELIDILVVTGGAHEQVEVLIGKSAQTIFNEGYQKGGMLSSLQLGLSVKKLEAEAALICLGDQPQVEERTVRLICESFLQHPTKVSVPSYQMRRGHPWLAPLSYWEEIINMKAGLTPRDFLSGHAGDIHYVDVETPSIIADLDTPDDYLKSDYD